MSESRDSDDVQQSGEVGRKSRIEQVIAWAFLVFVWACAFSSIFTLNFFYDFKKGKETHDSFIHIFNLGTIGFLFFFTGVLWEFLFLEKDADEDEDEEEVTVQVVYDDILNDVNAHFERIKGRNEDEEKARYECAQQAILHVAEGRSMVVQYRMAAIKSNFLYNICTFTQTSYYKFFMNVVIFCHMFLFLFGDYNLRTDEKTTIGDWYYINCSMENRGTTANLIFCFDGLCVAIEIFDVVIKFYMWSLQNKQKRRLRFNDSLIWNIVETIVIAILLIDIAVRVGFAISIEFFIPLRCWLLIFKSHEIREEAVCAIHGFKGVMSYACFILLFCLTQAIIFYWSVGLYIANDGVQWLQDGGEDMHNMFYSLIHIIIMATHGENLTTMYYPALSYGYGNIAFFVVQILVGAMVLAAIITSVFQSFYEEKREKDLQKEFWAMKTGYIAAYILIDLDGDQNLDESEWQRFVRQFRPDGSQAVLSSFGSAERKSGDISAEKFVELCEEKPVNYFTKWQKFERSVMQMSVEAFLESWAYCQLFFVINVATIWSICYYTHQNTNDMDLVLIVLVFLHLMEYAVRIWAYGFVRFFRLDRCVDHGCGELYVFRHFLDTFVMAVCFVGAAWLLVKLNYQDDKSSKAVDSEALNHWVRILPGFIVFRIFAIWDESLKVLQLTYKSMKQVYGVIVLILIFTIHYAIISITLFKSSEFPDTDPGHYQHEHAHFKDICGALIAYAQCFVGEAFHEQVQLLSGNFNAHYGADGDEEYEMNLGLWVIMVYYFVICWMLANLFFGLLLDVFDELYGKERDVNSANEEEE